jgi:hypothetical protein
VLRALFGVDDARGRRPPPEAGNRSERAYGAYEIESFVEMPRAWADSRWRALMHAALVLTAWLLFTRPALCAEPTFTLTWRSQAKTQCVTESALRAAVARKLGHAPFAPHDQAELVIEGEESALAGGRWRARIAQRDRGGVLLGEREITAKSCGTLLRAATFVVALFIDPNRDQEATSDDEAPESARAEPPSSVSPPSSEPPSLVSPPPSEPPSLVSPPPSEPPSSVSPPPAPGTQRPPARAPSGFDLRLGIGASAGTGLLPSVSGSLLAIARLERRHSRWSFDWTGAYSWPQAIVHGTVRGEFAAVEQRARACLAFIDGPRTRIEACGGVLGGAVIPQTTGVLGASDAWRKLIGPTSAIALELRAGRTAARLEAGVEVPLGRYAFTYLSNSGERKLFYTTAGGVVFVAVTGLQTIL